MLNNPFTPVFGGKPDFFFGRQSLLKQFDRALEVRGSDYRSLFITGARGSGKTALLEQLSLKARRKGWKTVDVGAEHALASVVRQLAGSDEVTESFSPAVEINVLGSGGSFSGKGTSKTTHYGTESLGELLLNVCEAQKEGVFVSVDEVQKVPLEDMADLCEAFQMASRKGHNAILVIAGLPISYEQIIHQDGCTFMRRAPHEELGLLAIAEVRAAYSEAFDLVKGLRLTDGAFDLLVRQSSGHPYMMQLLGYQLIEYLNGRAGKNITAGEEDVAVIVPLAKDIYSRRSLKPLLDELSTGEVDYLRAMAEVADSKLLSAAGDITDKLEKTAQQVSATRKKLIDKGIIVPVAHGVVRFNIPLLRTYVLSPDEEASNLTQLEAWGV